MVQIRTIAKYLLFIDIICFAFISCFYIYSHWSILEHTNVKECHNIALLSGIITSLYIVAGLFCIAYLLFNFFCNWCSQQNSGNDFNCKKVIFIIIFLGTYGYSLYEFIKAYQSNDNCYKNYKKTHSEIWLLFNAQMINIGIIFILWIFGFSRCEICKTTYKKDEKLLPK